MDAHRRNTQSLLTSTMIGKSFKISANRTNSVLSELGWIEKAIKGWQITKAGIALGGVQAKDRMSGIPYVRWPEAILDNKILIANIHEFSGKLSTTQQDYTQVSIVLFWLTLWYNNISILYLIDNTMEGRTFLAKHLALVVKVAICKDKGVLP